LAVEVELKDTHKIATAATSSFDCWAVIGVACIWIIMSDDQGGLANRPAMGELAGRREDGSNATLHDENRDPARRQNTSNAPFDSGRVTRSRRREDALLVTELQNLSLAAEQSAEHKAQTLLQSVSHELTSDERSLLSEKLDGEGDPKEILVRIGSQPIQRQNFATLKPGKWLSDEVISGYLKLLAERDAHLCRDNKKKPTHFFTSFFMSKLLNEGHRDPNVDGTYEYKNVKTWSRKVPGKARYTVAAHETSLVC
jgi:Ulp1 protease family, C-terminal catalytic domain